jgi:hypothetical protein
MLTEKKKALISDLQKLFGMIPDLIIGVLLEDEKKTEDAVALVRGGFGQMYDVASKRLVNYVMDEADKGNHKPLQDVASGKAFK